MDFLLIGLSFVAGLLVGYISFKSNTYIEQFAAVIWQGLAQNKRVIVSIDNEARIFERFGNRIRVTAGVVDLTEELPHGLDLESVNGVKSVDNPEDVLSSVERD